MNTKVFILLGLAAIAAADSFESFEYRPPSRSSHSSSPTSQVRPSTTSTGPSAMIPQATSSDTKRPVTATTHRDPTTCSSPTAAFRLLSTSWTATPATWLRSTTRARLPSNLVHPNLVNTDTCTTPTSPSKPIERS
ncbi:mucin-2-like isoform X1 [Penaeus monodon]|uniref:mucin-2-like isoform X1 n=1 Tax=Penaeus monodon TaxID=6687 RepID=UPI0018A76414|nr:mucin-2-like isoform X1 [Penaeus monodon]